MKSYRYFIFDLDGTLADSSPSIYASLRNMERELGLAPLPENILHRFVGPPLVDSFITYYQAGEKDIATMLECYRRDYRENTYGLTKVYPGVLELLEYIKAVGCHAAVATLKNVSAAELTLKDLDIGRYMDCVAAMDDVGHATKSELIDRCLARMGCANREEAVFFGDSPYDGIGARESGVDFVALTYGFGFLEPGSLDGIPYVLEAKEPMELVSFIKNTAKPA